jgi:5-methyltetrahydrofolate--homocysteine methyltransferase
MDEILKLLKKKILILDGAMGTSIQNYNLEEEDFRGDRFRRCPKNLKGINELLNLVKPEIICEIHRSYLEAGADIIETNTFNGNGVSIADYGFEDLTYEISNVGAKLAVGEVEKYRKKTGEKLLVAGSIGPSNKSLSMGTPKIGWNIFKDGYKEQIRGLIHGGVDILLLETIYDRLNIVAIMEVIEEIFEEEGIRVPIMISFTVDKFGKIISGETMESLVIELDCDSIISFGLNCSFGAEGLIPLVERLAKITDKAISIYPNAGLPNKIGVYEEKPEEMVNLLKRLIDNQRINVVGGCCGTTPKHTELMVEVSKGKTPRKI